MCQMPCEVYKKHEEVNVLLTAFFLELPENHGNSTVPFTAATLRVGHHIVNNVIVQTD